MRFFKSDNTAAVSAEILAAIADVNHGAAVAYGADQWSERLDAVFGEFFETRVRVFAVSSGTAANSLAIATFCPPWGTVLTHAEAHIERDECGAPEFFTGGAKLSLVTGPGAKIAAAAKDCDALVKATQQAGGNARIADDIAANGQQVHVIGGARLAGELDAKRAIYEGALLGNRI